MEQNRAVKLIDESGRIVLPVEVRQAMNWNAKTSLEIWLNATDDEVVIKKHTFTCIYCGATERLKQYQKQYICPACQREIAGL